MSLKIVGLLNWVPRHKGWTLETQKAFIQNKTFRKAKGKLINLPSWKKLLAALGWSKVNPLILKQLIRFLIGTNNVKIMRIPDPFWFPENRWLGSRIYFLGWLPSRCELLISGIVRYLPQESLLLLIFHRNQLTLPKRGFWLCMQDLSFFSKPSSKMRSIFMGCWVTCALPVGSKFPTIKKRRG